MWNDITKLNGFEYKNPHPKNLEYAFLGGQQDIKW